MVSVLWRAKLESVAKSSPEQHLIAACITRALQDVYEPSLSVNSRAWFFDESTEPFSFEWCMQSLELENMISKVREMILKHEIFTIEGKGHYNKKKLERQKWYTPTPDTPLKECNICHKILPETSFYMRNQLYRYPMCKDCQNSYNRAKRENRTNFLYGKRQSYQQVQHQPQL